MERDERAMESIARSFEKIAEILDSWYKKAYPVKPEPSDADVTVPKTEEQKLAEQLGEHDPVVTEWIGERERKFLSENPKEGS